MQKKGLLQRIHRTAYPNGKNLKAEFLNPYFDRGRMYTVPYLHGLTGFGYLKDKVTTSPTTWKEFFAAIPSYPGKTTIFDDKKEDFEKAGKHEYVLTSDDVEDANPSEIKSTFRPQEEENKFKF